MLNYDFSKHPIGNSNSNSIKQELPIDAVDKLANELVTEYGNPSFRKWYCGVIYEFGFSRVMEWRSRASEGKQPAQLFSHYATQARKYQNRQEPRHD